MAKKNRRRAGRHSDAEYLALKQDMKYADGLRDKERLRRLDAEKRVIELEHALNLSRIADDSSVQAAAFLKARVYHLETVVITLSRLLSSTNEQRFQTIDWTKFAPPPLPLKDVKRNNTFRPETVTWRAYTEDRNDPSCRDRA